MENIVIRGARTHNLKNVSVTIPRDRLCVITGLSGSGKSSLAFDTLYAEGQRRYVESLSAYARQFLQLMEKPDVDSIEGLSPAISIEQKSTSHNPRSTVGTITEIHDYLRLLFARSGEARCPEHGTTLRARSVAQMVDEALQLPEGRRYMILAPAVRGRKGEYRQYLDELARDGYVRARIDGEICDLSAPPQLDLQIKHDIDVVVDRLSMKPDIRTRLADSFETALRLANGLCMIVPMDPHDPAEELIFSSQYSCPHCGYSIPELEPRNFSFNNPHGACEECEGLGLHMVFSEQRLVPNPQQSLSEGAITGWDKRFFAYYRMLVPACRDFEIPMHTPWEQLSEEQHILLLYGSDDPRLAGKFPEGLKFEGVIPNYRRRLRESPSETFREECARLMYTQPCPSCNGARLKLAYRHVFVGGRSLPEVSSLSITDAMDFFAGLQLSDQEHAVASRVLKEITDRLNFLVNVGLSYLTLSRSAQTLSGGEAQRIRLASQIGAGLVGVMYTLDEPSIGLHQRDNQKLLDTLIHLRDLGNSVIVVEHDEDAIRQADYILDIGPGAGVHGGQVVASGTLEDILGNENSLTGAYLSGRLSIPMPEKRRSARAGKKLTLRGCSGNNLKNIDVSIPCGTLCLVTGVSGSGKSTLVNDTLTRAALRELNRATAIDEPAPCAAIEGLHHFDKIICIDQDPIGRTPRSNPATYVGFFQGIRDLFSQTPEARARGYGPGRFSFNTKGGRCEACQGDGTIKVEMHFLPDVYVKCEQCNGQRYNRETLAVTYKDKNISEVLNMTVEEAMEFFSAVPQLSRRLQTLMEVGLSYIQLGQSAITFSGGEAQRIKLAKELSRRSTGKTLYVLDEPTTGLHFHDIMQLLQVLMRLRDEGNTVIVIEHNLDVIKCADYIIDLGPEGGDGGGEVLCTGTPEEIARCERSYTGQFLRPVLERSPATGRPPQ